MTAKMPGLCRDAIKKTLFEGSAPLLCAVLVVVVGCDRGSPGHYRKDGFEFAYPAKWKIEKDQAHPTDPLYRAIVLKCGGGGMVTFGLFPDREKEDWPLERFAAQFSLSMGAALNDKLSIGKFDLGGMEGGGFTRTKMQVAGQTEEAIEQTLKLKLLSIKVPFRFQAARMLRKGRMLFVVGMAPVEKWSLMRPEIQTILDSIRLDDQARENH